MVFVFQTLVIPRLLIFLSKLRSVLSASRFSLFERVLTTFLNEFFFQFFLTIFLSNFSPIFFWKNNMIFCVALYTVFFWKNKKAYGNGNVRFFADSYKKTYWKDLKICGFIPHLYFTTFRPRRKSCFFILEQFFSYQTYF